MVLFLDFDGVLHAPRVDVLFARVPLFEQALNQYPNLDIVVSSSWRESHSLEELRSYFSQEFQPRLLGVTPVFPLHLVKWADDSGFFLGSQGLRQKEVEDYMFNHYPNATPWIAIDDQPELFSEDASLIYTPNGFDEKSIEELAHWVKAVQGKPIVMFK